jgi:hypothetical protein
VLNVDGSSLGNPGASGFGGVLKNSDGSWIGSFSGSVGFSNVLPVELLALYDGLRMAWDKGLRTLVCYPRTQPWLFIWCKERQYLASLCGYCPEYQGVISQASEHQASARASA